LIYWR